MQPKFIHLKCHSEFSIVDGIVRIPKLIAACQADNMPAVAITDYANIFGLVKFYKKATAAGIKPIIAADVNLYDPATKQISVLSLLCQSNEGYANLRVLMSEGYTKGQIDTGSDVLPTIQWEQLESHQEGLLVLSGGLQGDLGSVLFSKAIPEAEALAQKYLSVFGDRFYIELRRTGRENEAEYNAAAVKLAEKLSIPVVATNDIRFIKSADFEAHEARVCINQGHVLDDPKRPKNYSEQQYFRTQAEMCELFADIPEALQNTVEIAKRCNVVVSLGKHFLPNFPIPEGETTESYFERVSKEGLAKRLEVLKIPEDQHATYYKRLQYELDIINQMGFPGYFLIVADFIQWAKDQDIPVGPGRGSGAGSLVAYALRITDLDPIHHDLLFERFLNPERVSLPDFDIDFCMDNRDRVIDYVAQKYGRESVSQIITYGTMAAKAVVRDVGRVLGMPYGLVDGISKLIPFEIGITLDKALAQEDTLRERYDTEDEVGELIDLAKKLEGCTRNAGKHAGGVVIAPTKITDFTALYCEPDGSSPVTQFDKDDVEAAGLVKFDFLGLRTLTIIHWAVQNIEKSTGKKINIDLIPIDNQPSYDLLKNCNTTAVFQLESRGMKDLVRRLQPHCFDEITALVALFRPGPLQSGMVDTFIDCKHGRSEIEYAHPKLESILAPTYGVILYQEQVMQIAQVLAGYSLGAADMLRRAMGKKKPEEMAKQRGTFTKGAVDNGIEEKTATYIFDLMEKFAGYGFNKSHSAAYALVAYQTAYLKALYPAEFMAATLSSDMDNTDKVVNFVQDCEANKLTVISPNLNECYYKFTVTDKGEICYGLGAIKGLGEGVIEAIVESRETDGKFKNIFDLCRRVEKKHLNRRAFEAMIRAGAFDCFQEKGVVVDRASLLATYPVASKMAEQQSKAAAAGQNDLFAFDEVVDDHPDEVYVKTRPMSSTQKLNGERETLGLYISGHPLDRYLAEIAKVSKYRIGELSQAMGKTVVIAGLVLSVRVLFTKRGKKMAILHMEDKTAAMDITIFSEVYNDNADILKKDNIVVVKGEVSHDDYSGGLKIIAEGVYQFDEARRRLAKRLVIDLSKINGSVDVMQSLPGVLRQFKGGKGAVILRYSNDAAAADIALDSKWQVLINAESIEALEDLCGAEVVTVEY